MNTQVKLSEQRCPSCNAPLSVGPADSVVTCRYCNNSITINRAKAPANVPRVTSFGTPGHVPSTVLYLPAATIGASVLPALIPVVVLLVVAIGGAIAALGRRFVSLPATCRPNETLTISGKKFDGTQPAIVAGVNCKITIKDSTITSTEPIVKGGINLELRIENSKLKSKTHAIELASTNAKIWISGKSEISGDEAAIFGENNVELEVKDSTITGGQDGIHLGSNGKLSLTDTKVTGKEHGIVAGSNAKATMKNTTVTATEAGVHFEGNGALDARALTIDAGDVALFFEYNADAKIAEKSQIKSTKSDGIVTKSSSSKLQLDDTKIDAGDVGIRVGTNTEIRLKKGVQILGKAGGVRGESSLKLQMDGGSIESPGPAIAGSSGAEIKVAAGSSVKGTPAFQFPSNPSRFDVADGTYTGDKQLDSRAQAPSSVDRAAMSAVLSATNALVKTCKDGKSGMLEAQIVVSPNGRVSSVRSLTCTVSKTVEACALGKLRAMTFPPQSGMTTIKSTYTF